VVEAPGIPLAVTLTAANVHDSRVFEEVLDAIPPIKGPGGQLRKRPDKMRRQAEELGLRGWARSTQDGRVEAVFEGEPEAVRRMIRWCYTDRSGAEVHSTSVHQETPSHDLIGFEAR
jgi:acylphosphatase